MNDPYQLILNPGVLFFKMGFWVRFCNNVSIFTMLDYAKSSKTHYSALGGVVFKSEVQYEPLRYMDVALKTVLLNGLGPQIMKVC